MDVNVHSSSAMHFPSGSISYNRLPPHEADGFTSTSEPFGVGVSFTAHEGAVLKASSEPSTERFLAPGSVGLNGVEPIQWLRVVEPSESLEIHPADHLLRMVADMTGCDWRSHDRYLQVEADVVIWAACARFRAAALGAKPIAPLEADTRILEVAHHVAVRYLGGRAAHSFKGRLDQRRLRRVRDYLDENRDRRLSLAELSSAAAMSPFHFQRTFKRTTGLSPSVYVLAMRAERAHRMIASGATLVEACGSIGIRDVSYLRRLLRRFISRE